MHLLSSLAEISIAVLLLVLLVPVLFTVPLGTLEGVRRKCRADEASSLGGGRDAPGWTSAALFLRGTNKDSWFLGSASFTSCMCSINVPVVLLDGVKKLVVGGFLVDMHECSLVLPGEDDKKDVVAHPAPRAPSIHAQLLVSAPKRINFWPLQLQKSVTPFR